MKELFDGHLLGVEHQGGHVVEVSVRPNHWAVVVSRLVSERSITLESGTIARVIIVNFFTTYTCRLTIGLASFPGPILRFSIFHTEK